MGLESLTLMVLAWGACTPPTTPPPVEETPLPSTSTSDTEETPTTPTESTAMTADTGIAWTGKGGTVTVHLASLIPDQRIILSDVDGTFAGSRMVDASGVTVLGNVPIGGYVTAYLPGTLHTIGGVQDGDELWLDSSALSSAKQGEVLLEVEDHGQSYGPEAHGRLGHSVAIRGDVPFESTHNVSNYVRAIDGGLNVLMWAGSNTSLVHASDIELTGKPPKGWAEVTLDAWNHDPGQIAATYAVSDAEGYHAVRVMGIRGQTKYGASVNWGVFSGPGELQATEPVDRTFHERWLAELEQRREVSGQQLSTCRITASDDVPKNGESVVVAFTEADHPSGLSALVHDLPARQVEPLWLDTKPSCDGIPYETAYLKLHAGSWPDSWQEWTMYAPMGAQVRMPQLGPALTKQLETDVVSMTFRAFALQAGGFDEMRHSTVLFSTQEDRYKSLDIVGSTACVVSASQYFD
ncbi:MAG: hypothetical protein KTR31_09155 [Myxococcales bacterium]|nr:hypothetical protein [Myxococcales bacterium]